MKSMAPFPVLIWLLMVPACVVTGEDPDPPCLPTVEPCTCGESGAMPPIDDPSTDTMTAPDGTLAVRIAREPASLLSLVDADPLIETMIDHQVMESLLRISKDGKHVEPELAERFDVDDIRHIYTFYLAPDARWHDGMPVTSYDVRFVFTQILDPYGALAAKRVLYDISSVTTPDEDTVVFKLDHEAPQFLRALASIPILPEHLFGRTPLASHWAARAPLGSGPFRFVQWVPSRFIELERNPDWRGRPPRSDRILYHIVPDDRIALDMFRRGDLDIIPDLPASIDIAVSDGDHYFVPQPYLETWMYNIRHPVLSHVETRQAIDLLIDREAIACSILRCHADLLESPWQPDGGSRVRSRRSAYDPTAAKRLLDAAGWRDRDRDGVRDRKGLRLSYALLLPELGRDLERIATVIQEDLAKAGIEMRIVIVSRGAFIDRLRDGRFDAAALSLVTGPDLDIWSLLHSKAIGTADNFGGFGDAVTDEILDRLQTEVESATSETLMDDLSQRIRRLQPMTFLLKPYVTKLVKKGILGTGPIRRGQLDAGTHCPAEEAP